MPLRPDLAVKVARCIALWADLEVYLGAFLSVILHANEQAALAMYMGLENRSAQLRLITSAAEASLRPDQADVVAVLFSAVVRPAMRQRDKLAHWNWGHTTDLPDALLLAPPSFTLTALMKASKNEKRDADGLPQALTSFNNILVVRDDDLERMLKQFTDVKDCLEQANKMVWSKLPDSTRAEWLQKLSSEPRIREGLARLNEVRKK